jgi:hypothetical protein
MSLPSTQATFSESRGRLIIHPDVPPSVILDLIMRDIRGSDCRPALTYLFVQSSNEDFAMTLISLPLFKIFRDDKRTNVPIWPDRGPMRTWSLTVFLIFLIFLIFLNEFGKNWSIHGCIRIYIVSGDWTAYCQFPFDYNKTERYSLFSTTQPNIMTVVDKPVIMHQCFIGMFLAIIDSNRASCSRRCSIPQFWPIRRIPQNLNS